MDTENEHSNQKWPVAAMVKGFFKERVEEALEFLSEVRHECCPPLTVVASNLATLKSKLISFIYIPYLPSLHSPGWLLRYIVGPYNSDWLDSFSADFWAGITVALTLLPQALSYAQLAGLPPINGLYASVLPCAVYSIFGSSMQLAIGPVAIVSLLTGQLLQKYGATSSDPELVLDVAAQTALCCGLILTVMSLFNLGHMISFVSHPVASGFTSAAACLIGLSQLKSAFGFSVPVPQTGQEGYEFNYQVMQWYSENWNGQYETGANAGRYFRNQLAVKICFGLFVPLRLIQILKQQVKATPERKKTYWFQAFNLVCTLSPFLAIIIGAHVAWQIKHNDHYKDPDFTHDFYSKALSIVGKLKLGVDFMRVPKLRFPMGQFLLGTLPLTLISFMESYSVARRIASSKNQLHLLNASQEMWANGIANLLGSISSAFPVSGSFSRSSLNHLAGAKTPLSVIVTLCVVLLALGTMASAFEYIPTAALAAVIFVAISNLISFTDMWEAWKHSKKDFLTMMVTFSIVFIFDTSIGLAVGLGCSIVMNLIDLTGSSARDPILATPENHLDVNVVILESDVTFLSASRIKNFVVKLFTEKPAELSEQSTRWDKMFQTVSSTLDRVLRHRHYVGVDSLPRAIVLDFSIVRLLDLTGLETIAEILREGRMKGIKFVLINVNPKVRPTLVDFGFQNDASTEDVDLSEYLVLSCLPSKEQEAIDLEAATETKSSTENDGVEMTAVESKPGDQA